MGNSPEERRQGLRTIEESVGYLKGVVEGLDDKIDTFINALKEKNNDQDEKISANAKALEKVTKRVDRAYWTFTGVSGSVAFFAAKWHIFTQFIQDLFSSGGHH